MSEFVINNDIRKYFAEISRIPRGSLNEAAIANYLVEFAKQHGFEYVADKANNVIIYKPATKGYEDKDAVLMQAHIDMVCEKDNDSTHNFQTDPIELIQEGNILHANKTTLGADDGHGVSYMLAVLNSTTLSHPALECVFTASEEIGLIGAKAVDGSLLKAKKMINLDAGGETRTVVSCSGGRRVAVNKTAKMHDNELPTYKLTVTGLKGGHSGGTIDKERTSSIKLAFRVMNNMLRSGRKIRLVSANGGAKENAIPRECEVVYASDESYCLYHDIVNIKNELALTDPDVSVFIEKVETAPKAICSCCSKKMIQLIDLLPQGMMHKDLEMGIPNASLNLGVLELNDGVLSARYSVRSPFASRKEEMTNQIIDIASLLDGTVDVYNDYDGWSYVKDSPLREILRTVLAERGVELVEQATHGGLEAGVFKGKLPDLDIITYGPISSGEHTPKESLDLESFDRCYEVICEVLRRC